jgi:hypothetical protein
VWSLSAPTVHVGLSPHSVVLAHRSGVLSGLPRQRWVVQVLPCEPAVQGWAAVLPVLVQALAALPLRRPRVRVQLAGNWVRWLLLPWNAELLRPAEYLAYARAQCSQHFGPAAAQWTVLHSPQRPGAMQPVCAVDTALLQALHTQLQPLGVRLEHVGPYAAHAYDQWHRRMPRASAWFCALEADTLWLALVHRGLLQAMHVQRWGDAWQDTLAATMNTLGLTLDQPAEPLPLHIASPLPPVVSQPQWPFHWVRPAGLTSAVPVAARMAWGV